MSASSLLRSVLPLLTALIFAHTGSASPAAAPAEPPAAAATLQRAALPNGFRYVLRPHAAEPGRLSLRLIVHAGSLDEQDDELGFAHFVEHMAFNGTAHYPPGQLVPFFQRNGLAWGVDANADTSFTHTTYKIDLPAGHADQLREALQILRDFADGIAFDPPEVKRERGVILAELTARTTSDWQLFTAKLSALYAGSRMPARIPLADARAIKRSSADNLRDFYRRVYRPQRLTLLVVGDLPANGLDSLITDTFGTMRSTGADAAPATIDAPTGKHLQGHVLADPGATAATLALTRRIPVSADAMEAQQADLADYVVLRALDRRLKERQRQMSAEIGRAGSFRLREIDGHFRRIGLEVHSKAEAWPAAAALIEGELRRARENGFSAEEILELTTSLGAAARATHDEAARKPTAQLTDEIAASLVHGSDWQEPAQELAQVESWIAQFTPEAAHTALLALFPKEDCHLVLTLRQTTGVTPDALLAAYRESASRPLLAPTAATAELRFRYDDFGPPGAVAARRAIPELGVELVELANGVRLNVRSSATVPNHFKLVARIGTGFADIPRDQPGLPWLALNLLGACDLGRHTRPELGRLIRIRAVEAGVNYTNGRFTFAIEGPTDALDFALRFLAAFLSDIKLDEARLSDARSAYIGTFGWVANSSQRASLVDMSTQLRGGDARFRLVQPAETKAYSFPAVSDWTRTRWLEGPLEIALVGDLAADTAVEHARASLGTLPPRRPFAPLAEADRCVFPAKLYRNLATAQIPDRAATVQFAWVARDIADARRRQALVLANNVLRDRLRVQLREELGATYSPISRIEWMPEQPDFGFANMEITFEPRHAQKLAERVLQLADELARNGMTADEFARAKAPLVAKAAEDLRGNDWWLDAVLPFAQSTPAVLDAARTLRSGYESLTLAEANTAAKQFGLAGAHAAGIVPAPPKSAPAR